MSKSRKHKPLVSIIVPVFNSELYLRACLSSLLVQTYSNFEVIIVNDGSIDNSSKIISEFCRKNGRCKSFWTPNAGVSAARNFGLSKASGEFICFVDSDDFVAPEFIGYMVDLALVHDAPFCISTNCFTKKEEPQVEHLESWAADSSSAAHLLLSPSVVVGCWNKIYHTGLLRASMIEFDRDLFYGEGLHFTVNVARFANRVAIGNRKVYYYRKDNLESATTRYDPEKVINGMEALRRIERIVRDMDDRVIKMYQHHVTNFQLGSLVRMLGNGKKADFAEYSRLWMPLIRARLSSILKNKELSKFRRLIVLVGSISPRLLSPFDKMRRGHIRRRSIEVQEA
ncbi:glycosyltransferase family 2 protein [Sulfitobacter sp. 915]|uniref:glycosyltransferase family 2 protein n=1 Tax=Sulfitobacter sp. 915 TaxID=3368558 RepID=UPI00374672F6